MPADFVLSQSVGHIAGIGNILITTRVRCGCGWTVCASTNAYHPRSFVVFFEIDSFLFMANGGWWHLCAVDKSTFESTESRDIRMTSVVIVGSLYIPTAVSQLCIIIYNQFNVPTNLAVYLFTTDIIGPCQISLYPEISECFKR